MNTLLPLLNLPAPTIEDLEHQLKQRKQNDHIPGRSPKHIVVVERPVGETLIDLPTKGDSVGDLLVFANAVYDAANETPVGTDQGSCVRTVVGARWECFITLRLERGQITVEGPFQDSGDSSLVVTGGTGRYIGAKGILTVHPRQGKDSNDFTYDLM